MHSLTISAAQQARHPLIWTKPINAMTAQHYPLCCSTRLSLAILAFFGCAVMYSLRVNLSVAIVCMVNRTAIAEKSRSDSSSNHSTIPNECGLDDHVDLDPAAAINRTLLPISIQSEGEFVWDKNKQGSILGAFFWGYLFTQILGGWAAQRFGARKIITLNVVVSIVATLLTPIAARSLDYKALMALRVLMGLVQGSAFPGFVVLWTRWAPPLERSKLTSFTFAGMQIGNVISMPAAGFLCQYGFDGGWPSVFYVFGLVSILWAVGWFIYASDTPVSHRWITENERRYIDDSLGHNRNMDDPQSSEHTSEGITEVPWLAISKSFPVWACIAAHFAADWGGYLMLTCLPLFLNEVLKFDMEKLGFVASIPFLAALIGMNLAGIAADYVIAKEWMKAINVRKLMTMLSLGMQAVFLVAAGYCRCGQEVLVIVLLTFAAFFASISCAGFVVNYMEIAPRYAGLIVGVGNTVACVGGILGPIVMSAMTPHHTRSEWLSLFYVTAVILFTGGVIFCMFAKGDAQDWAKKSHKKPWSSLKTEEEEAEKLNR